MTKVRKKPKKNITKNINKKSFIQNTPNIAEKLDNEMVAFLDTEFLTSQVKGGPPAKLVSVGFVVCGKNFEEVTRFHSYIYAEDKLHDRFQEMTGIERKDLLSAPDYELVMEEVAEQLEGCSEHMLRIMKKYTAEKEVYYRQRRFREKWEDVSEEIQEKTLGLLKELGKVDTVEARALRDDLMVMCTGEAISFPTLEEYIRKEEKE